MPPEHRMNILDPFKLNKDNYPVIVHGENERLLLHDGNRRALNVAAFGMGTIKAYVSRFRNPPGKPAMPEAFLPTW